MSKGNIAWELTDGTPFPKASTTPTYVIQMSNASATGNNKKGVIFAFVAGAPATYAATSGIYEKGCIIVDTANGKPYSNTAAITTAPSWTVLS